MAVIVVVDTAHGTAIAWPYVDVYRSHVVEKNALVANENGDLEKRCVSTKARPKRKRGDGDEPP